MTERALTAGERDRLAPLLDETEIPVRVSTEPLTFSEVEILIGGQARGCWPRERSIVLSTEQFERADDEQLLGLFAHEVGHHAGYHGLVQGVCKVLVGGLAFVVLVGLLVGVVGSVVSERWLLTALSVGAIGLVFFCLPLIGGTLSRRFELDADRRGADLLGSTAPLEALYKPGADTEYASWWAEKCYPWPHPADRLAALLEYSV